MEKREVFSPEPILEIAKICHQANKAYCENNGDFSQFDWDNAPKWQQQSAYNGVAFRLNNPFVTDKKMHDNWMIEKIEDGWILGEEKDPEVKTHPCLVPYDDLPEFQRKKDALFKAIVDVFTPEKKITEPSEIVQIKGLRKGIDNMLQEVKKCADRFPSREKSLSVTKLQEGIMWLGMDLKRLNTPNPYPSSKVPETESKIEPTADDLKL